MVDLLRESGIGKTPPNKGASPASKKGTPIMTACSSSSMSLGDCSICLAPIGNSGKILTCRHHFHAHCIRAWFRQPDARNRCPECRQLHSSPTLPPVQSPTTKTPETPSPIVSAGTTPLPSESTPLADDQQAFQVSFRQWRVAYWQARAAAHDALSSSGAEPVEEEDAGAE